MEKQVKSGGVHPLKEATKKTDKELKLKEQKELALLFKPVQSQKIEKGKVTLIQQQISDSYVKQGRTPSPLCVPSSNKDSVVKGTNVSFLTI